MTAAWLTYTAPVRCDLKILLTVSVKVYFNINLQYNGVFINFVIILSSNKSSLNNHNWFKYSFLHPEKEGGNQKIMLFKDDLQVWQVYWSKFSFSKRILGGDSHPRYPLTGIATVSPVSSIQQVNKLLSLYNSIKLWQKFCLQNCIVSNFDFESTNFINEVNNTVNRQPHNSS